MCLFAYLAYLSGRTIISNIPFAFQYLKLDAQKLIDLDESLQDCLICIDEIHMYADSRLHTGYQNRTIGYFILQSRHRNVDVLYTTQASGQCDKRIRTVTDIRIVCENLQKDSDGDGIPDMFRLTINDRSTTPPTIKQQHIYGTPLFTMVNGYKIIDPFKNMRK